jgi:hypothetical protein
MGEGHRSGKVVVVKDYNLLFCTERSVLSMYKLYPNDSHI